MATAFRVETQKFTWDVLGAVKIVSVQIIKFTYSDLINLQSVEFQILLLLSTFIMLNVLLRM